MWHFWPKFAQKGNEIQKRTWNSENWYWNKIQHAWDVMCTNFQTKQTSLKKKFWGQNFKNLSRDLESASLRYYVYQFSDKKDNFEFLGPNLPKNGSWGRNFKNLSLESESTPPIYHVYFYQFSVKMDNF